MIMRFSLFLALLCLSAGLLCAAPPEPSWLGLTGIFTEPTAETLDTHDFAINYSEVRFIQHGDDTLLRDTWFTVSVTAVPLPRWEIAANWHHELLKSGLESQANLATIGDEIAYQAHVKYVLARPGPRKLGLAVGIQDITNTSEEVDSVDTERGRRGYLVGSYEWAHLGITLDGHGLGAYAGARWGVTDNIELLAEFVTVPLFTRLTPSPENGANFNLGVRIHPQQVPNLHFDLAEIGDGEFEFGFALGYTFR